MRGLVYYGPTAERNKSGGGGAAFANFLTARGQSLSTSIETLQNFAETTGGRAFYNRNDLSAEFKRAADDSSSYDLLGYYLDTHNSKAGWRKLKVKVLQRDTEVRARDGFLLTSATMNPDTTRDSDLKIALNSPFDATSIPLTLRWKTTAATDAQKDADKKEIAFTLHIPGKDLAGAGSENEIDVDVVAVARIGSLIADHVSKSLKGAVPPEKFAKLKSESVDYSGDLHLAPGNAFCGSRQPERSNGQSHCSLGREVKPAAGQTISVVDYRCSVSSDPAASRPWESLCLRKESSRWCRSACSLRTLRSP